MGTGRRIPGYEPGDVAKVLVETWRVRRNDDHVARAPRDAAWLRGRRYVGVSHKRLRRAVLRDRQPLIGASASMFLKATAVPPERIDSIRPTVG